MKKQTRINHNQEHMKKFGPEYQIFSDLLYATMAAAENVPKEVLDTYFTDWGDGTGEYEYALHWGRSRVMLVTNPTEEEEW